MESPFIKTQFARYYGYGDPSLVKLIIVGICIITATLIVFFTIVQPPAQIENNLQTQPVAVAINTNNTAISPGFLTSEYVLNSSAAYKAYSGKMAYLDALVGNVELGPTGYRSCVSIDSIGEYLAYGCAQVSSGCLDGLQPVSNRGIVGGGRRNLDV